MADRQVLVIGLDPDFIDSNAEPGARRHKSGEEGSMGVRRKRGWMSAIICLGLASCSVAPQTVVRNATGADILLWPLAERPVPLRPGETTSPIVYSTHARQQALIERGNCLYTYPAPDYFALPKRLRSYPSRIVVVIREDMTLGVHPRSKDGVEGPEVLVAGFPLKPATFCGRRGQEATPRQAD